MAAVDAAAHALDHELDRGSRLTTLALNNLALEILEDDTDHPDESDEEGAEHQTARVVPEGPPVATADAEVAALVSVLGEVPGSNSHDQHVLSARDNQSSHPEEAEQGVPEHVLLFICELVLQVVELGLILVGGFRVHLYVLHLACGEHPEEHVGVEYDPDDDH